MPPGKPPTIQSPDFQRRPGTDPFGDAGWRGVNTEDDPGSLAPNELQLATDVRLQGKNIKSRPGMTMKIDLSTHTNRGTGCGAVTWMENAPGSELRTRLWCSTLGCLSATDTGYQIYHIDPVQNPPFQRYVDYRTTSDRFSPIGRYGDKLLVGDGPRVKEIRIITLPPTIAPVTMLGSAGAPLLELATYTGYTITFIKDFSGAVFVGLSNDTVPGNSKIVRWDGSQWTDDITGIRPPLSAGYWRDKLVVGFDSTAAHIRVRDSGTAATWTTVALAGFQCTVNQNAIVELGAVTFIASGIDKIFQYDGTNLTLAQTVAGCDATGDGVTALCRYQNLLHYGWNAAITFHSWIGRYDPDSSTNYFIDGYLDVTAQQATFTGLTSLESYRTQIYMGGRKATFLATAPNDVKGTLQVINTGTASAGFRARQLMVFP